MQLLKPSRLLLLSVAALFVALFLLMRPGFLGGDTTYIIVRGESMEPTLHGGDFVVLRQQNEYGVGDIVAYRVPEGEPEEGFFIMHRIVDQTEEGFVTQGDNKERADRWRPTGDDTLGRLWFNIPGGGQFLLRLRQPMTLGLLAGGLGMLTVLLAPAPARHPKLSASGRRSQDPAKDTDKA